MRLPRRRYIHPAISLLIFVVPVHFFAVINDGNYWDGWPLSLLIRDGDWDSIRELMNQVGVPLIYYLYKWAAGVMPDFVIFYRLLIPFCMLLIAYSTHFLARRVIHLPARESWFVAAFSASWPFYQVFLSEIFLHYMLGLALFYLGWVFYFQAQRYRSVSLFFIAYALLAATSYTLNSFLMYFYGFVVICFVYGKGRWQQQPGMKARALYFLRRKWPLCIFPVLLFIVKDQLSRPYGLYADYNVLLIKDHSLLQAGFIFLQSLTRSVMASGLIILDFAGALRDWWLLAAGVAVLFAAVLKWRAKPHEVYVLEMPNPRLLAVIGLLLLLLSIAPYAMVGKFTYSGWGERHGMLMPFGIALMIAALSLRLRTQHYYKAAFAISFWVLFINAFTLSHAYLSWEGRAVIDKAVIDRLENLRQIKLGTVIIYQAPQDYIISTYRPYELNSLLYMAWDRQAWFMAAYDGHKDAAHYLSYYNDIVTNDLKRHLDLLQEFKPNGCVATLTVKLTDPTLRPWKLALEYYDHALYDHMGGRAFLRSLIIFDIKAPGPTDVCPSLY